MRKTSDKTFWHATVGSYNATQVAKSPLTPPLGQNNGTFVDFVYEKGDGCLKGGRFDIESSNFVDCTEQHILLGS